MIFKEMTQFITISNSIPSRLFLQEKKWKREVIIRTLYQLSSVLKSEEEHAKIKMFCEKMGVVSELKKMITESKDWWTVADAIRVVGKLRITELIPAVERNLQQTDYEVWNSSARVMNQLNCNHILLKYLIENENSLKQFKVQQITAILISKLEENDIEIILSHFEQVSPLLKGRFIKILGNQQSPKALTLFESLLSNEDREIRIGALKAIGEIRITTVEDKILAFFKSEEWTERMVATKVVQNCGIRKAIPQLTHLLADAEWWVRLRAAEALFSFGTAGKQVLEWCIENHEDPFTRDMAFKVLREKELEVYSI